jgi:hypothetical protein
VQNTNKTVYRDSKDTSHRQEKAHKITSNQAVKNSSESQRDIFQQVKTIIDLKSVKNDVSEQHFSNQVHNKSYL